MLLSIAMLFQEQGVDFQSFPALVLLLASNLLLLSKRGAVSYAGGSFLLFCVPSWKALSERLSSRAESRENDRRRSARLAGRRQRLDEMMHSYPCLLLSQPQDRSISSAT